MSTGAENDIEVATNIARKMVKEYGMSDRLGPVALGHKEELVFLGREIGEQKNYSEKVAEAIDEEIRRLIDQAYLEAIAHPRRRSATSSTAWRTSWSRKRRSRASGWSGSSSASDDPGAPVGTVDTPPAPQEPQPTETDRPSPQPKPRLIPGTATGS